MRLRSDLAVFAAGALLAAAPAYAQTSANPDNSYWNNPFGATGGPNAYTESIVSHPTGIIMGGDFARVGELWTLKVARWDGSTWHSAGTGVGAGDMDLVHVVRLGEGCAYAGGMFDRLGLFPGSNIARFDFRLQAWTSMGSGTDRAVRGISVAPNGDVYIVGEFGWAGGKRAQAIARWDGTDWYDVGGSLGPHARAMAVAATDDGVYVGGYFDRAGDQSISYIAKWNGTTWEPLGGGVNNLVTAITVKDGVVYAAGAFTEAGGWKVNRFARWDGKRWYGLGNGLSGSGDVNVRSILIDVDQIYIGGTFIYADGKEVNRVATWYGGEWQPLGSGVNDHVKSMTFHEGTLWVAGDFTEAGGKPANFVAQWTKPGYNTVKFDRMNVRSAGNNVEVDWQFTAYGPYSTSRLERRAMDTDFETVATFGTSGSGSYTDAGVVPGRRYEYALVVTRENGTEARSAATTVRVGPASVTLMQNTPNPFNPTTVIEYGLPQPSHVDLRVFDATGGVVRRLVSGYRDTGVHEASWDGRNDRGQPVATGVYFYRLTVPGQTPLTKKMILVK